MALDLPFDPDVAVAIIYRARRLGRIAQREIDRLTRQLPGFKIFAVCYNREYRHAADSIPGLKYCYGQTDLEELPYAKKLAEVNWNDFTGNHDLPVFRFFRDHPEFDRYWVIEDDVRYSDDWNSFFVALEKSRADLLMTVMQSHQELPDWFWWKTLTTGDDPLPCEQQFKGFGPLCRLSAACLTAIDQKYRSGWSGHFEVTWPTITVASGLTIEDIGGEGSLVPPERRGLFYTCGAGDPSLFPGTFVFRPPFHDTGVSEFGKDVMARPMLWHPVKHSETTSPKGQGSALDPLRAEPSEPFT